MKAESAWQDDLVCWSSLLPDTSICAPLHLEILATPLIINHVERKRTHTYSMSREDRFSKYNKFLLQFILTAIRNFLNKNTIKCRYIYAVY